MTPGTSTLFQVVCTTRDDMLKRFSFKAEGECRLLRFDRTGKDIF